MQSLKYSLFFVILIFSSSHSEPSRGHHIVDIKEHEFPFLVSISEVNELFANEPEYNHYCTGSLISNKHVLTAAHCVADRQYADVEVLLGSSNLKQAKKYNVESWITYNTWFFQTTRHHHPEQNDIAIITLKKEVHEPHVTHAILSKTIQDNLFDHTVTSIGWGATEEVKPPLAARKVTLKTIPNGQCTSEISMLTNRPNVDVAKRYLCTQIKPWALIDEGDSGGPLLDEHKQLVGVNKGTIPHFEGSGQSKDYINEHQYNLHMSVYFYRKFIEAVLQPKPHH